MSIREFSFKMINNTNELNARLNHLDEDINDYCSYCLIDNEHTSNRETLEHFYGHCSKVQKFTKDVLKEKFNISNYSKDWNLVAENFR